MSIAKDEAEKIRIDIALLKLSVSDTLTAVHDQASSSKDLLQSVNELTIEIREDRARREAHDENRETKDKYIQDQISSNTKRLDYFTENYKQPIEKLIVSQVRWEKFISAIFSKAGTTVFIITIVVILYLLGINPKDIKFK